MTDANDPKTTSGHTENTGGAAVPGATAAPENAGEAKVPAADAPVPAHGVSLTPATASTGSATGMPDEAVPVSAQAEQGQDFVIVGTSGESPATDAKESVGAEAMWDSLKPSSTEGADEDGAGARHEFPEPAEQAEPVESRETAHTDLHAGSGAAGRTGKGPFNGNRLGPKIPSIALMRDAGGNLVPTPPTPASRVFGALSLVPLLPLIILLAAQVVFTLDTRALWFSDEVRYADAYRSMIESGNWLVLHLNGEIYPDKPPLFFWFLYGLDQAAAFLTPLAAPLVPWKIAITRNMVFFAGVALSGLLCLIASHCLAVFVARVDRRTALASGIILISGFFFSGLLHYLRMDLLFTALITFSHVFLYHAWMRKSAFGLMTLGFLCAGAAVLVKGPLGLAFPLLAAVFFLLWEGRISRLFKLDTLWGVILGLAIPGTWLALAWMDAGDVFLANILHKQILERALDTWHHAAPWYHYLVTFPLMFLPWTPVLLFLPWGRLFSKPVREAVKASRTPGASGTAYLWCAVIPALVMLSLISIKLPIYALPLLPPMVILCAKGVLRMRPAACAALQYTLAVMLAVLGLTLILLPAAPKSLTAVLPFPMVVPAGHMVLGGICLVTACILAFLIRPRRSEGLLLVMALFAAAFAYPAWSAAAPSLDALLSPKTQAEIIKKYRDAGYAPASFKIYPGTYSYYAGKVRNCKTWDEAAAFAADNPKVILALRASFWDALDTKPQGLAEVDRRFIAERDYVLVARPPLEASGESGGAGRENRVDRAAVSPPATSGRSSLETEAAIPPEAPATTLPGTRESGENQVGPPPSPEAAPQGQPGYGSEVEPETTQALETQTAPAQ